MANMKAENDSEDKIFPTGMLKTDISQNTPRTRRSGYGSNSQYIPEMTLLQHLWRFSLFYR